MCGHDGAPCSGNNCGNTGGKLFIWNATGCHISWEQFWWRFPENTSGIPAAFHRANRAPRTTIPKHHHAFGPGATPRSHVNCGEPSFSVDGGRWGGVSWFVTVFDAAEYSVGMGTRHLIDCITELAAHVPDRMAPPPAQAFHIFCKALFARGH